MRIKDFKLMECGMTEEEARQESGAACGATTLAMECLKEAGYGNGKTDN